MLKLFNCIIFFFFTTCLVAQNYAADIESILSEFALLRSYSIKVEVSVVGDDTYVFEAWTKSSGYGSHIRTDISEMLVNDHYAISVDHEDKIIRVQQGDFKEKKSFGNHDMDGMDMVEEYLSQSARVEYLGSTETYKTYVLYHDAGIEKTIIKINTSTNFFQEIEVFYNSENSSVSSYKIVYSTFERNPIFERAEFDESIIVKKIDDKTYEPVSSYKGYTVQVQ